MWGGGISSRIYASTKPAKLNYIEGEQLDLSGMVINFKDGDNEPLVVSDFKTIPADGSILSKNDEVIQIEYQNNGTTYLLAIPIKVKYPVGIRVKSFPNNLLGEYDSLFINKIKVVLIYNDGSETLIDNNNIITEPDNTSTIGLIEELKIIYNNNGNMFECYHRLDKKTADDRVSNIATFKSASYEQISYMVKHHYTGDINIADFWKVGDERENKIKYLTPRSDKFYNKILLYYDDDVKLVILDINKNISKTLPIYRMDNRRVGGVTTNPSEFNIAAVIGTKDCLKYDGISTNKGKKIYFAAQLLYEVNYNHFSNITNKNYTKVYDAFFNENNYFKSFVSNDGYGRSTTVFVNKYKDSKIIPNSIYNIAADCYSNIDNKMLFIGTNVNNYTLENAKNNNYYIKLINEKTCGVRYTMSSFILMKSAVFGDNCLEYYKTASNRIKCKHGDHTKTPIKYFLADIDVEDPDFFAGEINSTHLQTKTKLINKNGYHDFGIKEYYVDEHGEFQELTGDIFRFGEDLSHYSMAFLL